MMMQRTLKDKVFFWILLLLPIISSVLSTIHVIALTSLSNPFGMAIATACTFEVASLVSFLLSSGTILQDVKRGWVFFIFILLFLLQASGNIYAGFANMSAALVENPKHLDVFMEMCFNIFTLTEAKWVIAAAVGLPLPLISLIMIKFALDSTNPKPENAMVESNNSDDIAETTAKSEDHIDQYSQEDLITEPKEQNIPSDVEMIESKPIVKKK